MTLSDAAPEILIIDDTPSNLSVVANLFEDRGYRVSIAQDGAEGMQRARLLHPDLILLDVMMPGVDGFEVCGQLKADPVLRDIPVIFMTALASVEHKVKGFKAGAVDYVTKPLQIDEVMARVATHLKLHAIQQQLAAHNEELERRVAERTAELAAREREFRTLVENAPDDIARHDRRGRFFYINPQHEKTLGVALDNLIGKTPVECFPGIPDVEAYQAQLMAVIETGRTQEYGVTMPDTGDGPRYHSVLLVAERGEDGEIVGVLAIGRDITERKQAERELLLLNRAVNASSEAAFLMDAQGRFVYVNQKACCSLGLSRDELLGMTPLDIDPDITPESFKGMLDSIFSTAPVTTPIESHHRSRVGRVYPVEIAPSPLTLEGENYCLTMVRDISERKQAERLLHEREQAILAMVENSPDTVVRYDSQCRRTYLNPAMAEVFGRPRDELLGTSPTHSSPLPATYLIAIKTVLDTGVEQRMEASYRHADGSVHWVDLRLAPEFDADGKVATVLAIGRDITERKFAEQALAASEREFRTLVENVPDNIARHDLHGRLVYINPQMQRTFQRPAAELYGKSPLELVPESADARAYLDCILAVAQTGLSREYDVTMADMGDGLRYHSILLVAERDAEGKVVGVLTLGRDITERKRAERLLHEKDQAIRAVVENSPDAHARYDRQYRRLYVNPATERLLGLPQEEIIGKPPVAGAVLPPEFIDLLESVFQSGEEVRTEMPFRWPNGEQGWGDVRIVPEFGPDGSVATVLSIGRDITERKRMELALQENEQRYREIFDNAVEGMYLLEVTEDGRFRNIDINPALAASTGIPREVMIGKFVDETVSEEVGRLIVEKYQRCVAGGKTMQEQIELDLPAGKHYYYSTITPIHNGERIHRLIGISRDITELKRAERELQESREQLRGLTAQREAAREEERKHIAREVHDELGQLLTGLKLNVSVLAHMLSSGQEIKQERLQESMQLTDRALVVARNVASALRPAALDMGVVSALEWLIGRFSRNTGIQCELSVQERDIQLEENQAVALFRIVQESLTNVSRHAQAGRVDISLIREGDDYVMKVRDNGLGFDANKRKAESFGLVGIRERALLLGGTVAIESQPGNGTGVVIRIPVQKTKEGT